MNHVEFVPGDDFEAAGVAAIEGITDFTGYTATATITPRDPVTGALGESVAQVEDMPMTAEGGFLMEVSRGETVAWPVGVVMLVQVVVTSPSGLKGTTSTSEFKTALRLPDPA